MKVGIFPVTLGFAIAMAFGGSAVRAGDDGAAPLWSGVGSVFAPLFGLGGDEKDPIDYREHGKIVLPPKIELPAPSSSAATASTSDWPVDQETERKKLKKAAEKDKIAGQGDARLRYTHPFDPNTPVTVRPGDQANQANSAAPAKSESTVLGNLNPMGWVGLGKSAAPLGPEPDREWLTDPPKGYRAPLGQSGASNN